MKFAIINVTLNLTQACNLRCGYCFTNGKTNKRMSLETGKKSIDFLFNSAKRAHLDQLNGERAVDISFWGGEPLLEWKLMQDLVLYTEKRKDKNIKVSFGGTTNGTLLTKEKLPFLQEHGIFFMVSIDGTQKTHDRYRTTVNGSGSHTQIMKNMETVMKWWPFCQVRMSPYPERIGNFYEDFKYLIDHGMYNINFSPVLEHNWTEKSWKVWENQSYRVVDLISKYRKKGIFINNKHFIDYCGRDDSHWPCGAGRFYAGIDTDGAIFPCHRFIKFNDTRNWKEKEMCVGHIKYGITKPELIKKFIYFQPDKCKTCDFWYTTPCRGGCYATNFDLTGDIEKSTMCRYVEMQTKVSKYYMQKIDRGGEQGEQCVTRVEKVEDINKPGLKAITPQKVMDLFKDLETRVKRVEKSLGV